MGSMALRHVRQDAVLSSSTPDVSPVLSASFLASIHAANALTGSSVPGPLEDPDGDEGAADDGGASFGSGSSLEHPASPSTARTVPATMTVRVRVTGPIMPRHPGSRKGRARGCGEV